MWSLEQVTAMSPLVDQELEHIDRRNVALREASRQLNEALNMYHNLMKTSLSMAGPYYNAIPQHQQQPQTQQAPQQMIYGTPIQQQPQQQTQPQFTNIPQQNQIYANSVSTAAAMPVVSQTPNFQTPFSASNYQAPGQLYMPGMPQEALAQPQQQYGPPTSQETYK